MFLLDNLSKLCLDIHIFIYFSSSLYCDVVEILKRKPKVDAHCLSRLAHSKFLKKIKQRSK